MPVIKSEDYTPDERIFAAHISRSGSGKSSAAASYPRPYHQIDYDGRFDGVFGALKPQGFLEPEQVTFERFYARHGYEPLQKIFNQWEAAVISRQFPYKTIELASLTNLTGALITSSHRDQAGKMIGSLRLSGPGDFNFEVSGMKQIIDFLGILPCHVICSAHIIDKWGKPPGEPFAPNIVTGEKLCLRDQLGEVVLSCFSNVFKFDRKVIGETMHYYVEFAGDVAKNAFGIPPGQFDITGVPFYPFLQDLIRQIKLGIFKKPEPPKPLFGGS